MTNKQRRAKKIDRLRRVGTARAGNEPKKQPLKKNKPTRKNPPTPSQLLRRARNEKRRQDNINERIEEQDFEREEKLRFLGLEKK